MTASMSTLETQFPVSAGTDILTVTRPNGDRTITYITDDPYPSDGDWDWFTEDGEQFREYSTQWDRDEFIERIVAMGVPVGRVFVVNKYDHSAVHYSIAGTVGYVDARWDAAPKGVYVSPAWVEPGNRVESANQRLDTYSQWCNGWVYGVASETYTPDGELVEDEACWGFIGDDEARAVAKERHESSARTADGVAA